MMELVKKNIAIVVCVVIAIVAIVADFYPLAGFRDELRQQAQSRAAEYAALDGILNKSRTLPIVDPTKTEATPLEVFPTQAVYDAAKAVVDKFVASSQALLDTVVKMNEHQPLWPGALPAPQFVQASNFKLEYQRQTDLSPAGRANSMPVKLMRAGFAPTQDDLKRAMEETAEAVKNRTAIVTGGQIVNQDQVKAAVDAELNNLQDRMVREVADRCLVYINPDAMDENPPLLNTAGAPEPSTIFWAQLRLWVQEDVFKAIRAVNESYGAKVGDVPIKHLLRIDVMDGQFIGVGAATNPDPNAPPVAISTDPDAPLTPNYQQTPTGRTSNGLFDVVHVKLTLVVDAARLPMVLDQLSHGRLLNVIQVERVEPLDIAVAANAGYFYGDRPCVRVELVMEDLLMRKWTEQYMPDRIKQMLGIMAAPPPAG